VDINLITYFVVIFSGTEFNITESNKAEFAKAETIVYFVKEEFFEAG